MRRVRFLCASWNAKVFNSLSKQACLVFMCCLWHSVSTSESSLLYSFSFPSALWSIIRRSLTHVSFSSRLQLAANQKFIFRVYFCLCILFRAFLFLHFTTFLCFYKANFLSVRKRNAMEGRLYGSQPNACCVLCGRKHKNPRLVQQKFAWRGIKGQRYPGNSPWLSLNSVISRKCGLPHTLIRMKNVGRKSHHAADLHPLHLL